MKEPEQIFDGYEILAKLGQGATGSVFKARHFAMDKVVAIKTLQAELASDRKYLQRFKQEAKAISRLDHKGIVKLMHFSISASMPYIVYQYAEGETLAALLSSEAECLSVEQIISITSQVATALDHAHKRHVVHRDIKPANIVIDRTDWAARLLDFGIASMSQHDDSETAKHQLLGTPAYMSPEQVSGKRVDGRSDLYSLGCILYEMLYRQRPFDGNTAYEVTLKHLNEAPQFPPTAIPELADICRKLLAKDPKDRYHDGAALVHDLLKIDDAATESGAPLNTVRLAKLVPIAAFTVLLAVSAAFAHFGSSRSVTNEPINNDVALIDRLKSLIEKGTLDRAHEFYVQKLRSSKNKQLVPVLERLCLHELERQMPAETLSDLRDYVRCIECTRGNNSRALMEPILKISQIEILMNQPTITTYNGLQRVISIAAQEHSSQVPILLSLKPKMIVRLASRPEAHLSKERARSQALAALREYKESIASYNCALTLSLDYELTTLECGSLGIESAEAEQLKHIQRVVVLLREMRKEHLKELNTSTLMYILAALKKQKRLSPACLPYLKETMTYLIQSEPNPSLCFELQLGMASVASLVSPEEGSKEFHEILGSPLFAKYLPMQQATIYHQALFQGGINDRAERALFARKAYDEIKSEKCDGYRTAAHVLGQELAAAGRYREALPYLQESLILAVKLKTSNHELARLATGFAEIATKFGDARNKELALSYCKFLDDNHDPKLAVLAAKYQRLNNTSKKS